MQTVTAEWGGLHYIAQLDEQYNVGIVQAGSKPFPLDEPEPHELMRLADDGGPGGDHL